MPKEFMSDPAKDFAMAILKESTKQLRRLQDD
jgi:hypothetical protein